MATFEIKSDLPLSTQEKIDYIEAIPSARRTVSQAAFLTSLTPYLTNVVLSVDIDANITAASGLTVPTGYEGFAKGATFVKTDASGNGLYMNIGTSTVASWDLVDEASTANIPDKAVTMAKLADIATTTFIGRVAAGTGVPKACSVAEVKTALGLDETILITGTPVNAVAANKLLTIGTNPLEGATVSIGGKTYKFREDALGAGVAATGTLTMNTDQPHNGDTVLMGGTTYTFKTALTTPVTVPNEVLIAATTTEASMENLIKAIEGTGTEGVEYSVGTVSQGAVTATKATADTMLVTYDSVGFLGNQYDTAGTATHATWGHPHLLGGVDPQAANDVKTGGNVEGSIDNLVLAITAGAGAGTNYGTGTTVNSLATAVKASAATMTATNKIKGVIGNSTAIAETLADGSWASGATFLSGGVDGTVGSQWEVFVDASYLYVAIAANTAADTNWRRISLGTAY